jgi:hypothetical protein
MHPLGRAVWRHYRAINSSAGYTIDMGESERSEATVLAPLDLV